ncbi:uncharacterized protein LOC112173791 [Rosa chinensis]|uniref:uncharacterized protein LOC112173791 n=1 Tax=Rosa chinensis TaxID=74649 RepID=UPI001AD94813|nr:uncharacterized protein LOC112173791 [Rosa chinensis]
MSLAFTGSSFASAIFAVGEDLWHRLPSSRPNWSADLRRRGLLYTKIGSNWIASISEMALAVTSSSSCTAISARTFSSDLKGFPGRIVPFESLQALGCHVDAVCPKEKS